jgi:hypothetical protein
MASPPSTELPAMSDAAFPPPPFTDTQALYRTLQADVRRAIDRCANGLGSQLVACPSDPNDPTTTLENVLRSLIRTDAGSMLQRVLMVIAQSARDGDAVACFVVERMATAYAAQQVTAMFDAGLIGAGDAAA